MAQITFVCPFCGHYNTRPHDGLYAPRYAVCDACGERFIYEPGLERVNTFKPGEAPCCSDPDCRELEMMAHCEQ